MNVYTRLRVAANQNPQAIAIIAEGTSLTYGDLLSQINRCVAGMRARGCKAGDAVALALPNGVDFVVVVFAAFALGCVVVPLNPRFQEDELRHYLQWSNPRAIFYPPALERVIGPLDSNAIIRATDIASVMEAATVSAPPADGDGPGVYMFSSGSTGKSKRITRTQPQILREYDALSATIGLSASDRILCTIPLFHAHGFGNALMASLLSGGQLVLLATEFNARATACILEKSRITIFPGVPFMFKMLSETRFANPPQFPDLRLAISAGAPLPNTVSEKFRERFSISIGQLYGSTETGAISINTQDPIGKPSSVGLPLSGYHVEVRDEEGGLLPSKEAGEIWIQCPAMSSRYDSLPDVTEECFRNGYFFAGDTGYLDDDGFLYVTGRKKLMVNVAGFKVDPVEVEGVIAKHPGVADTVVVGVEHPGYGEKLKAFVVRQPEQSCTSEAIVDFTASQLAEYKVPKVIEFVAEIPRNPLGKVLRKYLA